MTRAAAIQMTSGPDVNANLEQAGELIRAAADAGAALIVLPENFACMPSREADRLTVAEEPGGGPIQDFLAENARQNNCHLIGGTISVRDDGMDRVRAACLVFDTNGQAVARYDKIHLFDISVPGKSETYQESSYIEPGDRTVTAETAAGRIGLAICYDVRFPELFRALAADDAELVALPSAFTAATGRDHWEILVRARAIENLCYVVAACQEGRHPNGRETFGDSMIVDPWGKIVARRPQGPGIITADIDITRQRTMRDAFPVLQHRRLD